MKFLVAFTKGNKNLVKIAMDDGTEKWATTTPAVINYAKTNFVQNEEAKFEMTEKNGQYHVTKILKADGSGQSSVPPESKSDPVEFKCTDCGAKLKDGKYKKCYTCNQKNPVSTKSEEKTSSKTYSAYQKSPEDKEQIKRLSVLSSSSNAVANALQGQIGDASTLAEMIIAVYEILYKKVSE
jgi:hypothetical protein